MLLRPFFTVVFLLIFPILYVLTSLSPYYSLFLIFSLFFFYFVHSVHILYALHSRCKHTLAVDRQRFRNIFYRIKTFSPLFLLYMCPFLAFLRTFTHRNATSFVTLDFIQLKHFVQIAHIQFSTYVFRKSIINIEKTA